MLSINTYENSSLGLPSAMYNHSENLYWMSIRVEGIIVKYAVGGKMGEENL